jgi:hypothetical protein
MQMRDILDGNLPSSVFRRIFAGDGSITTQHLAEMLIDEFPDLDGEVVVLFGTGPDSADRMDWMMSAYMGF